MLLFVLDSAASDEKQRLEWMHKNNNVNFKTFAIGTIPYFSNAELSGSF
jgi:hypothetical protein